MKISWLMQKIPMAEGNTLLNLKIYQPIPRLGTPFLIHRDPWAGLLMVTFYFMFEDEEALLPYKVMRHEVGTSQDQDDVVYEEKDSTFYTSVGNAKSVDYIEINISSTTVRKSDY